MIRAKTAKGVVSKRDAFSAVFAGAFATTHDHLAIVALVANVTVTLGAKVGAVPFDGGRRAGSVVVTGVVETRVRRLANFAHEHWHSVVILLAA